MKAMMRVRTMTKFLRAFFADIMIVSPIVTTTDQAQYIYNDLGQLSQVINGQGNIATYIYSAAR